MTKRIQTAHLLVNGRQACGLKVQDPHLEADPYLVDCACCERTKAYKAATVARAEAKAKELAEAAKRPLVVALAEVTGLSPLEVAAAPATQFTSEQVSAAVAKL